MGTLKEIADTFDISKEIAIRVYRKAHREGRTYKEVLDEELEIINCERK